MDNPKKANQGKYSRSKRKKEHFSKGSKSGGGTGSFNTDDGGRQQSYQEQKSNKNNYNIKGPQPQNAIQQQSNSTTKASDTTLKADTAEQKIVIPNLKKETEEIANLTQKYGRRRIISTWTRDFEPPPSKASPDRDSMEEGADFKDLISGYSTYFVGRHFMLKEEQEWMNQTESCESPFSLDLKCLETGISSIPFYKRHDLSEKSFNPKEVQTMVNEAESNEVIYKEMANATQETQKVILNKQNSENNDNLITKDFVDDDIISLVKKDKKKSENDPFVSDKSECNNINSKNDSKDCYVEVDSTVTSLPVRKASGFNKSTVQTDNLWEESSSNSSVVNNHTFTTSNSKSRNDHVDIIKSSVEDGNLDLSYPIQSLEPRSQRRPRREVKQAEINASSDINDFESNDGNFTKYSFIGLNPRSRKNTDNVDDYSINMTSHFENKGSNKIDSSGCSEPVIIGAGSRRDLDGDKVFNLSRNKSNDNDSLSSNNSKKDDLLVVQAEIDRNCDGLNINRESNNEEIELNLSGLMKSKGNDKPDSGANKNISDSNSILSSNNDKLKNNMTYLSSKDHVTKGITKDDIISNKNHDKINKSSSNYDGDDDLDILLGLDKPSTNVLLPSSLSKVNQGGSSNLLILQEKLKGSAMNNPTECNTNSQLMTESKSSSRASSSRIQADEDLDEWLDSVLEN